VEEVEIGKWEEGGANERRTEANQSRRGYSYSTECSYDGNDNYNLITEGGGRRIESEY
jgi:hypothetical protein